MIFKAIHYFTAVAECLSFSSAAERLCISQPGLSKLIANMEEELGFALFERTTRKVTLTEDGKKFYELSRNYLAQCRELAVHNSASMLVGNLSIGFGSIVDERYLPVVMNSFKRKFSKITLSVALFSAEELLKALADNTVDLGIISSYAIPREGYKWKVLFPSKLQVVVWKNHWLTKKKLVNLRDLKDEPFVFVSSDVSRGIDRLRELCAKAGFTPRVAQETNDFRLLYMLIAQERGIAFNLTLPDVKDYPELRSIDLDMTDFPEFRSDQGLVLAWSENNTNPAVGLFTKLVLDLFRNPAADSLMLRS